MNELIRITYDNDRPTVSARELYKTLEVERRFSVWFETNSQGFVEGDDFTSVLSGTVVNNGAHRELQDYDLSVDMAKHICLMSRTDKGKKCRQALIDLEKDWNSPEKVMARALKIAQNTILKLTDENAQQKQIIAEYSPKASYYDVVLQTPDALSSSQIAKDYGKSAKWLNQYLHDKGVQYNQGGVWLLYQKYAEQGYTRSKTHVYCGDDGQQHSKLHTYWTAKGAAVYL